MINYKDYLVSFNAKNEEKNAKNGRALIISRTCETKKNFWKMNKIDARKKKLIWYFAGGAGCEGCCKGGELFQEIFMCTLSKRVNVRLRKCDTFVFFQARRKEKKRRAIGRWFDENEDLMAEITKVPRRTSIIGQANCSNVCNFGMILYIPLLLSHLLTPVL